MSHVLIAGGTGMLKNVSLYFTSHGMNVSVIARNPGKFEQLILSKGIHGYINPLRADYNDYEQLKRRIVNAVSIYGPIETVVAWIHSSAPEAPHIIAEIVNSYNIPVKYFHILGIEHSDPSAVNEDYKEIFYRLKNIFYRKVILGFIIEDDKSRWLTDTEISNGVIDALKKDDDVFTVGRTEPWEMKP